MIKVSNEDWCESVFKYLFSEPYKSHIPPLEEMCGSWADLLNPAHGQFFTSNIITTTSFFSRSCFLTDAHRLFSSVVVMLSLFLGENSVVNKDFLASDAISFSFMLSTMLWWIKKHMRQTSKQNSTRLQKSRFLRTKRCGLSGSLTKSHAKSLFLE